MHHAVSSRIARVLRALLIGVGTGCLAPAAAAAEDAMWTTGVTIAQGNFSPEDMCRQAGNDCKPAGDVVLLEIDHAAGVAFGTALAKITYTPVPECADWELVSYMEFVGTYSPPGDPTTGVYMVGQVDVMSSLDFEMYDAATNTCKRQHRDIPDSGAWEGGYDEARGIYVVHFAIGEGEGGSPVAVTLTGAWSETRQADSPAPCASGDTGCAEALIKRILGY